LKKKRDVEEGKKHKQTNKKPLANGERCITIKASDIKKKKKEEGEEGEGEERKKEEEEGGNEKGGGGGK